MARAVAWKINLLVLNVFISRGCVRVFMPQMGAGRNVCGWQEHTLSLLQMVLSSRLPHPARFCRPLTQCDDIFILLTSGSQMFSALACLPWGRRGDVSQLLPWSRASPRILSDQRLP